jgi:hypothetical protein
MRVTTILCHPGRPSSAVFRQNLDLIVSSYEEHYSLRFGIADIPNIEHYIVERSCVEVFILIVCHQLCLLHQGYQAYSW